MKTETIELGNTRIAVVGASGQLGSELCRQYRQTIPLSRPTVELTDLASLGRALRQAAPQVVINTAGFTNVDDAENQPELCWSVNAHAVENLVRLCQQLDCLFVQLSTDYVFHGDASRTTPFTETEMPAPGGIYAESKGAAEMAARSYQKHLIVRTCGLYGQSISPGRRKNFVDTMLDLGQTHRQLRVVDDQTCTPSYVPHVARAILFLSQQRACGTFHVVNAGSTTWYGFAQQIFRLVNLPVEIVPITSKEYAAKAARPAYSVLDTHKYLALGGPPLPAWQQALSEYLDRRSGGPDG